MGDLLDLRLEDEEHAGDDDGEQHEAEGEGEPAVDLGEEATGRAHS